MKSKPIKCTNGKDHMHFADVSMLACSKKSTMGKGYKSKLYISQRPQYNKKDDGFLTYILRASASVSVCDHVVRHIGQCSWVD